MDDHPQFAPNDLTALVGSRLCHDLINPLGAIGNGVELMAMSTSTPSAEMSLIEEAVRDAQSRIRFFRIAFGAAAPDQRVARREISDLLAGLYGNGGRLSVAWTPQEDLLRRDAKLALLCLACAEHALPLGGELSISVDELGVSLRATARRVSADPELWAVLSGESMARRVLPAEVQFLLLAQEAALANRRVIADVAEDGLTLAV